MKCKSAICAGLFTVFLFGCSLKSGVRSGNSIDEVFAPYRKLSESGGTTYLVDLEPLHYRLKEISRETTSNDAKDTVAEVRILEKEQAQAVIQPEILRVQILSGMSASGRLVTYDPKIAGNNPKPRQGEKGPYRLGVALSELTLATDIKTTDSGHTGTVLRSAAQSAVGFIPGAAMFAGLVAPTLWNTPLDYKDAEITSVVGLEITLTDPRTNRVVESFPVRATSTKKVQEIGSIVSLHSKAEGESPLEEATRLAILDGVQTLLSKLDAK